jgi:hypothetical protein
LARQCGHTRSLALAEQASFLLDYVRPLGGKWVKPLGLSARLLHVCDGGDLPSLAALRQIGKDAICAFILSANVCHEPTSPDDIPF